ncbi:GcrA cell cycle regulator [Caulobacter phage CcrBL10]|uniref:GcrA cell cycle regulator n=1 Tax=Caulobacter phage CcrBL10 TaxID=2283269 RepID=A0A385E9A5_9CAUD|nr:GcrA cell cycle regulator [Caulobacter phage CcrBL10]AXQ68424.1 GcrA cell cycle regulator [Caulobacter phage CcrBL10]
MKKRKSDWLAEDIALLKKLWAEPVGTKQIGEMLREPRSKSAVCGMGDRLRQKGELGDKVLPLQERRKKTRGYGIQIKKVKVAKPKKAAKPKAETPSKPKIELVPEGQAPIPVRPETVVPTLSLGRGMCRWPYGDPTDQNFGHCGCRTAQGVYCIDHHRMAYRPFVYKAATRPSHVGKKKRA